MRVGGWTGDRARERKREEGGGGCYVPGCGMLKGAPLGTFTLQNSKLDFYTSGLFLFFSQLPVASTLVGMLLLIHTSTLHFNLIPYPHMP